MCTFLLGKESSYYKETLVDEEEWDINRPELIGTEPLLDLLNSVFTYNEKYKKDNQNKVSYLSSLQPFSL